MRTLSDRAAWLWKSRSLQASAARGALTPFAAAFRAVQGARAVLYDRGLLRSHGLLIPAVSVGNISVGGAGKTPVAAWLARRLADEGVHPAIVLRGYGGDEALVHATLNPGIPVFVDPDRVAGVDEAARSGADVAVLDDAFQHRRATRDEDIVLIAADSWLGRTRLLPAGPWREPLSAVRRATVAVVTRKAAGDDRVESVRAALHATAPDVPVAVVRLAPTELRSLDGRTGSELGALRSARVLAVCGVADAAAFFAQVEQLAQSVVRREFPDHYRFTSRDAAELRTAASGFDAVVCTLKDAVKLAPIWAPAGPGSPPAWYLSQSVIVEQGDEVFNAVIRRLLARCDRPSGARRAGPAGAQPSAHE